MPDLNIKGNIIDNFGTYLPTPIIDSVEIYNDKIRINVSLFFNFTDLDITDAEIDNYIATLSNTTTGAPLYVWGAYILGQPYIDSILDKNNIDIMSELYGAEVAEFEHEHTNTPGQSEYANYASHLFDTVNTFTRSDQNFYDNADNKVIQYGGSIELPIKIGEKELSITDLENNIFLSAVDPIVDTLQDMSVFAFTSWQLGAFPLTEHAVDDDDRKFVTLKIDLLPPLAEQQVSNVSYASVFKGGHADVEPKVHFIDENEVFYNKTPIQVIDGKYYKQDAYTLEQIVALFESYISSHKMAGEDNDDVKSVLDNIAYVLSLYGDTTQLLIELNKLRQTFPEKSSATEVGSLYAGFKDRFFGANEKVAAGTPVVEKLVRTSKIRDLRDLDTSDWVPPTRDPQELILASPSNGGLISSQVLYTQDTAYQGGGGSYYPPEADAEAYVKNGFWFFNYEQALKRYANVTGVLSLDTLYKYAGKDMVYAHFKLTSATMTKWVYDPNHTGIEQPIENLDNSIPIPTDRMNKVATLRTDIEYNSDDVSTGRYGPRSVGFVLTDEVGTQTNLSDYKSVLGLNFGTGVHTSDETVGSYTSFLALRGIDAFSDSQVGNGYQLAAFNFQDVEESYSTAEQNEVYSFQVEVTDTTKAMATALLHRFASYYDVELKEYYDYASENCNYNNVDGAFNEFFTEGVMTYYKNMHPTDKKDYPWIKGPIYYNLFREILTDFFGGDEQKLVDDAAAISAKINPINGTLENLTAFYENFGAFLTTNFAAASGGMSLTEYLEAMDDETILTFGENHDVQYYPIPTPVPIVPEFVKEALYPTWSTPDDALEQRPECASTNGSWVLQNASSDGTGTSHNYDKGAGYVVFVPFGVTFDGSLEDRNATSVSVNLSEYRDLRVAMAEEFVGWKGSAAAPGIWTLEKFEPIVEAVSKWVDAHDEYLTGVNKKEATFYYTDAAAHTGACLDGKPQMEIEGLDSGTAMTVSKTIPVRVGDQKIKCQLRENPSGIGANNDAYVKCKQYIFEEN